MIEGSRARRILLLVTLIAPVLVMLAIYWTGLRTWFYQDDFAWLSLSQQVTDGPSLLRALFAPLAQGTIRPWSERLFFLVLEGIFGLNALPYRIVVFVVMAADLCLASLLVRRITGSAMAGMWTAIFWVANSALSMPLSWTSSFNQILLPCFLLGGLNARLTYLRSGNRRWLAAEWAIFLLGFGALELQVVYPALALGLTLLMRKAKWRSAAAMLPVSILYAVVNRLVAGRSEGIYAWVVDASIFDTLRQYLWLATGCVSPAPTVAWTQWAGTAAIGGFLLACIYLYRSHRGLLFFSLLWFFGMLAPLLPLRHHISDYYLAIPVLGLAIVAGIAMAECRPAIVVPFAALYIAGSVTVTQVSLDYRFERSQEAKRLVLGVAQAHRLHPKQIIVLSAVSSDQYWSAVNDAPFRLLGPDVRVYLAPGAEELIDQHPELGDPYRFVLPARALKRALADDAAVVYSARGNKLTNVTEAWREISTSRADAPAKSIDLGEPLFSDQLGPGWHAPEVGFRWMTEHGSLQLGGPVPPGHELTIHCFRPAADPRLTVTLSARVNGVRIGSAELARGATSLEARFPLPPTDARLLYVELIADPPLLEPGGGRQLGLAFGSVQIQKLR